MTNPEREYAAALVDHLLALAPEIKTKCEMGQSFETRAPKPEPDLRVSPHF